MRGGAKPCLQIEATLLIIDAATGPNRKEPQMSHYLLASGDLLVIAAIILSVAYLSWKQFSK